MKGIILFFLVVMGTLAMSFLAASLESGNPGDATEFSTFTSALCKKKGSFNYCRDELFVSCNGNILRAIAGHDCNGFKIENKVAGSAVFDEDWKDSRIISLN